MESGTAARGMNDLALGHGSVVMQVAIEPVAASDLIEMCKPRIVMLICLTSLAGAFAAAGAVPELKVIAGLTIAVTLSAAGASALNHYFEREVDARMQRTRDRPLPSGRVSDPRIALILGFALLLGSLPAMAMLGGWVVLFGLLGFLTYAHLYTLVLKPRTVWSIVFGGLAGSFAALGGYGAVASPLETSALWLSVVLFLWTPPHFWSLAIALEREYSAASLPMLPSVVGVRRAARVVAWQIPPLVAAGAVFGMSVGLSAPAIAVTVVAGVGWAGAGLAMALTAQTTSDGSSTLLTSRAWTTFKLSGLYLLVLLSATIIDVSI